MGNSLIFFSPFGNEPVAGTGGYATIDIRNQHPTLDFDPSITESAVFTGFLSNQYVGAGVTVNLAWAASTATGGSVLWQTQFERLDNAGQDTDSDNFGTAVVVTGNCQGVSGSLTYSPLSHSVGSAMGQLVAGELFRLKVQRVATGGSDTMPGDAELFGVTVSDT